MANLPVFYLQSVNFIAKLLKPNKKKQDGALQILDRYEAFR